MLRQVQWGAENGPITKKQVLPFLFLFYFIFFENLVLEPLKNS